MRWQYLSAWVMYTFVVTPIFLFLSVKHRITPFALVKANPEFKYGGMEIDSKYDIHKKLLSSPDFLVQERIDSSLSVRKRVEVVESFMKKEKLTYPVIIKPERGCVGFGIKKITSKKDLEKNLCKIIVPYLVQKFSDYNYEYGVYYRRFPWEKKGKITSITKKIIPTVIGDGKQTVGELVNNNPAFEYNKGSLLTHAKNLDYVVPRQTKHQVIVQGSHTYGAIFKDETSKVTKELEVKFDTISKKVGKFYTGRYDVKAKSPEDFYNGKGIKVIEVNGCMSEPTHMYDDKHSFSYGVKQFYSTYNDVFAIAKYNLKKEKRNISSGTLVKEFKEFIKTKSEIMKKFG